MAAPAATSARRVLRTFQVSDFSGGWNPRSTPALLADNESPDMLNVTIDEQGGLVKRLGYQPIGVPVGAQVQNLFFWPTAMAMIAQAGANVYKASTGLTSWTLIHTFTADDRAAFCDFQGQLVSVHPVDGVAVYPDGGTWTPAVGIGEGGASVASPKGSVICVWQNKVWVAGDPQNIARVWASNAGHPEKWDVLTDFNDMREKDNTRVTALLPGQGFDAVGRPGLMVFKKDWWGRIDDPKKGDTIGRYLTLHNEAGAAGPECVATSTSGAICAIGPRGIYASDGVNEPKYISEKIENLFNPIHLNLARAHRWSAIPYRDRVLFMVTRGASQQRNNFMFEYHPLRGWVAPHSIGFASSALFNADEQTPYVVSPDLDGQVFQLFKGWADNGANIAAHHQTRWYGPGEGYKARLRRLRLDAHGSFDFFTRGDYSEDPGILNHFTDNNDGSTWDNNFESFDDFWSLNVAKTVAWRIEETSQTPAYGRKVLGGAQPEIGSFAVFGYQLDFIRLGYA